MNWKHLFWIIPLSIFIGMLIGNELKYHVDQAPKNPNVNIIWDCEEGCLYSDWFEYGYTNRTAPSKMYNACASICRTGFVKTPTEDWRE